MANATYDAVMISTSIRLDGVPFETYNIIRDFINTVLTKRTEKPAETAKPVPADKYAAVSRYKGYEKIVSLFKDADEHPEAYVFQAMTSFAWQNMVPGLKGVTLHTVAHTLGSMATKRLTEKVTRYNSELGVYENYYRVPVPTAENGAEPKANSGEAISPDDVKRGKMLRNARIKHEMSVSDLAAAIGYDEKIIRRWESGMYHMSDSAVSAIKDFFKEDIFKTEDIA